MLTTNDRIDLLIEAQEYLEEAIKRIKRAVRDTSLEDRARAYIIPHLESWATDATGQICNLDNLMNDLDDAARENIDEVVIEIGLYSIQIIDRHERRTVGHSHANVWPAYAVEAAIRHAHDNGWRIMDLRDRDEVLSQFERCWLKGMAGVPAPSA